MNYITMLRKSAFLENENKLWGKESMNKTEIYKGLRNKFGDECQIIVAIEELAELQKELTKLLRCNSNLEAITEEIADVEIMLEQLKIIFDNSRDVARMKNFKLRRVEQEYLTPPLTPAKYIKYAKEMIYKKEYNREILLEGVYKNYSFLIVSYGTHPACYILLPKESKFYGKSHFDIDLNVHGGITYSQKGSDFHVCSVDKDCWVIGWDYAHAGDYLGFYEWDFMKKLRTEKLKKGKRYKLVDLLQDCRNAIEELVKDTVPEKEIQIEIENLDMNKI